MGDQTYGHLIGWNVNKYWKWVHLILGQDQASKEVRHRSLARTTFDRKPKLSEKCIMKNDSKILTCVSM